MGWRLEVVLRARHDGADGPIPIGSTTDPEAVRVVANTLVAEARENADCDDPVLGVLTTIEADRMQRTIEALLPAAFPTGPRLVPEGER